MKNEIKIGDLVEMTSDWTQFGKPRGSIHEVLKVSTPGELISLSKYYNHDGIFNKYHLKLHKSKYKFKYPKRLQHLVPKVN